MQKMLQAEIWTVVQTKDGNAVLLRPFNKNVAVPIFVGQLEIQSILIGKEKMHLPRPLTHDLFLNLMEKLNLILNRVEIHDIVDNTFHARLIITGENYTEENPLILDSRPSDALALAVRRKCSIFVSVAIIRKTSISLDIFTDVLETGKIPSREKESTDEKQNESPLDKKRRIMQKQLNDAVESEEYEKAAEIRDLLKDLDN